MRFTMRCLLALVAVCAAVSAIAQGAPHVGHGQASFQDVAAPDAVPEPDFVDTLIDEAHAKHVPLDKNLNVLDGKKAAAAAKSAGDDVRAKQAGWKWESCGDENNTYVVDVESIELSPDPPQPGKNLTITAVGVSHAEIAVRRASCMYEANTSRTAPLLTSRFVWASSAS